jgi:hypothetical protein
MAKESGENRREKQNGKTIWRASVLSLRRRLYGKSQENRRVREYCRTLWIDRVRVDQETSVKQLCRICAGKTFGERAEVELLSKEVKVG